MMGDADAMTALYISPANIRISAGLQICQQVEVLDCRWHGAQTGAARQQRRQTAMTRIVSGLCWGTLDPHAAWSLGRCR